jgi:hypothetical protein
VLVVAAGAAPASAQAPEAAHDAWAPVPGLVLDVSGQCPSRDAVLAALVPALTKDARVTDRVPLLVVDLGDRFQVAAGGQTRQYDDDGRDCVERARIAAVYIALALNPPMFQAPPPPPPPPSPPIVERPAPAAPPAADTGASRWGRLGIAARVDGAAAGAPSSSTAIAAGGELRGAFGWRGLGVAASAGILSSTTNSFASVPVSERRFPCSIALTAHHRLATSLEIAGDLGVALVPFTLAGEGLQTSDASTRLDVGARLAVALAFPSLAGVAAPFVGLHAELYPRAYVVNVSPSGDIGETSRLWVGASAGVSVGSR